MPFKALITTLFASGLVVLLLTSLSAEAANLPGGPETPAVINDIPLSVPAARSNAAKAVSANGSSRATGGIVLAGSPGIPDSDPTAPLTASQFNSLEVADYMPSSAASRPDPGSDSKTSEPPGNGPASMPLVALAWLFGIGVIAMGTVGRRRKQP